MRNPTKSFFAIARYAAHAPVFISQRENPVSIHASVQSRRALRY
jgi:hypothetical protein